MRIISPSTRSTRFLNDIPIFAPPAIARWLQDRATRMAMPLAPGEVGRYRRRRDPCRLGHPSRDIAMGSTGGAAQRICIYLILMRCPASLPATQPSPLTAHSSSRITSSPAGRRLDMALLPIGHAPWWKPGLSERASHECGCADSVRSTEARYLIPYHWGTFDHVTSKALRCDRPAARTLAGSCTAPCT